MSGKSWTKAEAQQMFFSLGEGVLPWTYEVSREGVTTDLAKINQVAHWPYSSQPKMCKNVGLGKVLSAGLCVTLLVLPDHCTY